MHQNRVMRLFGALLLVTLAVAASAASERSKDQDRKDEVGLFLARIKVQVTEGVDVGQRLTDLTADREPPQPLRLALLVPDISGLSAQLEQTDVKFSPGGSDQLVVEVTAKSRFGGQPASRHSSASWVIDYEQPSVQALLDARRSQKTDGLAEDGEDDRDDDRDDDIEDAIAQLIQFSGDQIQKPNYRNGFHIASQVAKRQEGDCSEYAVLQTAFARAEGYPARVIVGLLFEIRGDALQAWGHAWSEIHDGEGWVLADSTRPLRHVDATYYLPVMELENEGTGHILDLVRFSQLKPTEVTLLGAEPEAEREPPSSLESTR